MVYSSWDMMCDRQTDRQTDRRMGRKKKWHIEVDVPPEKYVYLYISLDFTIMSLMVVWLVLLNSTKLQLLKIKSYVLNFFIFFHQMIARQKLWKMVFISSKKLFLFSRNSNFWIAILHSFSPCKPLLFEDDWI